MFYDIIEVLGVVKSSEAGCSDLKEKFLTFVFRAEHFKTLTLFFFSSSHLFSTVIFAHASFRLRNMKNKLENKIEGAGLKRSPMGILLEALGQQEENIHKLHSLLEGKLKE